MEGAVTDYAETIHLVIEPPVTEKQLAAIRLFAQLILKKGYEPMMLGNTLMAIPPKAGAEHEGD